MMLECQKILKNTLGGGWYYKKTTTRIINSYILGDKKASKHQAFRFYESYQLKNVVLY